MNECIILNKTMITPVNLLLAKLLEERNYDKPTNHLYVDDKLINTDCRFCNWNLEYDYEGLLNPISAPTIIEVIMWIYNIHGYWIEVYIDDDGSFGYLISKITKEGRIDYPKKRNFDSVEKAYEIAVEYTLKNLINTK